MIENSESANQPFLNSNQDIINSQSIVNNQTVPNPEEMKAIQTSLRSSSQFILCPFCTISGMTIVEKEYSCSNILCCIFSTPITWLLFQVCRQKDLNCYNVTHRCQKCGNVLGTYRSC